MERRAGERVGPYEILYEVGRGGMGVVYRAQDDSGAQVAIKCLRTRTPVRVEAFKREIAAVGHLRHPGVIELLDSGIHEGVPWYSMPLMGGRPLEDHMIEAFEPPRDEGAVPTEPKPPSEPRADTLTNITSIYPPFDGEDFGLDEWPEPEEGHPFLWKPSGAEDAHSLDDHQRKLLGWVGQVCRALAYIHGQGMIHCDLKPANILISEGRAVLIDFGLVIRLNGRMGADSLVNAGLAAGTAQYTCPERARGREVDARSDLYAIGCILFQVLTGRAPFASGDVGQLLHDQVHTPPPLPSKLSGAVPEALEHLIMSLLEKEPRDRPGHALVVVRVLEDCGIDTGPELEVETAPYLFQSRFMGREEMIESARSRLKEATGGRGRMLLVTGEAGMGKTRVAVEFVRRVRHRVYRVFFAQCEPGLSETGGSAQPMHLWQHMLDEVAEQCRQGGPSVVARLLGDRAALLARYAPSLVPFVRAGASTPRLAAAPGQKVLFEAVFQTLTALNGFRPTLLVLDDLQWADELSARCLEHIVSRSLSDYPWLVLGLLRTEGVHAFGQLMGSSPNVEHMAVGPLDEGQLSAIVEDMLGMSQAPEALGTFIAKRCRGNPFFVGEYLHLLLDRRLLVRNRAGVWVWGGEAAQTSLEALPLPMSVLGLIDHRIQGLSEDAMSLCALVSMMGHGVSVRVLLEIGVLEHGDLIRAMGEAIRCGILSFEEGEVRFIHTTVRERSRHLVTQHPEALHAQIAAALERHGGQVSEIAHHWACAGESVKAREAYLKAAGHAMRRYATEQAMTLFGEALGHYREDSVQSLQLRCGFARELFKSGTFLAEAESLLESVVVDARRIGAETWRCEALQLLGTVCFRSGRLDEARGYWEQTLALSRQLDERGDEACALLGLGSVSLRQGYLEQAQEHFSQARFGMVQEADSLGEAEFFSRMAVLIQLQGWLKEAEALLNTGLKLADTHGDKTLRGRFLSQMGEVELARGNLAGAKRLLDEAGELQEGQQRPRQRAQVLMKQGSIQARQGLMEEAEGNIRLSLHLSHLTQDPLLQAQARLHLAELMMCHGELAQGIRESSMALETALKLGDRLLEITARCVLGEGFTLEGRPADAAAQLETALKLARGVGSALSSTKVQLAMARACERVSHYELALEWVSKAAEVAHQHDLRETLAWSDRLRARLARLLGEAVEAGQSLGRAAIAGRTMGLVFLEALCLCERGQLFLWHGQRAQALMALDRAHNISKRLGVGPRSRLGMELMALTTALGRASSQQESAQLEDSQP